MMYLHQRENRRRSRCDNGIDHKPDELGRELDEPIIAPLRPAILDGNGTADDPAEFVQPLDKSGGTFGRGRRCR